MKENGMVDGFDLLIALLLGLLAVVVFLSGAWRVFSKAGRHGWLSLVPIVNVFVLLRIARLQWWYCFLLFIPVLNCCAFLYLGIRVGQEFGKGWVFGSGLFLFSILFVPMLGWDRAKYPEAEGEKIRSTRGAATVLLLACLLLGVNSGCAAIGHRITWRLNLSTNPIKPRPSSTIYIGARSDVASITGPADELELILSAIDLPFSFVLDTVLLPYDITDYYLALRRWQKREDEAQERRRK